MKKCYVIANVGTNHENHDLLHTITMRIMNDLLHTIIFGNNVRVNELNGSKPMLVCEGRRGFLRLRF